MFVHTAWGIKPLTRASLITTLQRVDYKTVKGRYHLYDYYATATKFLLQKEDHELLNTIIRSYITTFHYDATHLVLEPFIPYYQKHKATVVATIKLLATKKEAKDFFLRLDIAEREYLHGNG